MALPHFCPLSRSIIQCRERTRCAACRISYKAIGHVHRSLVVVPVRRHCDPELLFCSCRGLSRFESVEYAISGNVSSAMSVVRREQRESTVRIMLRRSEEAHGSGELNAKVAVIAHDRVSVAIMISRSVTGDRDSFTPARRKRHPATSTATRECPFAGQVQAVQQLEWDPVLLYLDSLVSPVCIL
jgi:hypothetical protein